MRSVFHKNWFRRLSLLCLRRWKWDRGTQKGPVQVGFDFEKTSKLFQSFSNPGQSDPSVSRFPETVQNFARHSHPVILHGKNHLSVALHDAHIYGPAPGVTMNIGESFLQNTKQRRFGAARQPG